MTDTFERGQFDDACCRPEIVPDTFSDWIATSVGGNVGLGVLATATTNWMEGKPDVLEGAKNAFILNASAPLLSAEAPLLAAGAGLSTMTETTFGTFKNAINLIEAYLPAARTQHVPTPLPNPRK